MKKNYDMKNYKAPINKLKVALILLIVFAAAIVVADEFDHEPEIVIYEIIIDQDQIDKVSI